MRAPDRRRRRGLPRDEEHREVGLQADLAATPTADPLCERCGCCDVFRSTKARRSCADDPCPLGEGGGAESA